MIPRYVILQINEQVYLPLAAVHAVRLRLSDETKSYLVTSVSTCTNTCTSVCWETYSRKSIIRMAVTEARLAE